MIGPLRVESTRGDFVESVHQLSVAVVDSEGRLVARTGDPELTTFWRSAAKPFQAMPVVADGAADQFGFTPRELALSCASHSSEPVHLEVAEGMLKKVGLTERALACGTHPPLSPAVAEQVLRQGIVMTPKWSNCSGKHAGMLALARTHGWPIEGYEREGHPLQQRILTEVVRWTDCPAESMRFGVDGCTVVCFGLPLRGMARAYARFGRSEEPAAVRLREAMAAFPELIAGQGRLETDLGHATRGAVIAKVGADGIYCAALPHPGLGIALKVHDGDMRSSAPALLAVLRELGARYALGFELAALSPEVMRHAELPTLNTRGARTGVTRVQGALQF
ncbi:MAG: asparaginase [Gemmatimonadota bacterium]